MCHLTDMESCVSVTRLVISLTGIVLVNTFLLQPKAPRNVVKTLGPTQQSQYGTWGRPDFCAHGSFATGYNMKIEPQQHGDDDTSLNAIELNCTVQDGGHFGGTVSSTEGLFGSWGREASCPHHDNEQYFLTEFRLQVEGDQHGGDDTAANYIEFRCRDFAGEQSPDLLTEGVGHGFWGVFSGWHTCPPNSAICGIQTRVEDDQHGGDDTSLNDVMLFCCDQ